MDEGVEDEVFVEPVVGEGVVEPLADSGLVREAALRPWCGSAWSWSSRSSGCPQSRMKLTEPVAKPANSRMMGRLTMIMVRGS
jgi:hypothetical protein